MLAKFCRNFAGIFRELSANFPLTSRSIQAAFRQHPGIGTSSGGRCMRPDAPFLAHAAPPGRWRGRSPRRMARSPTGSAASAKDGAWVWATAIAAWTTSLVNAVWAVHLKIYESNAEGGVIFQAAYPAIVPSIFCKLSRIFLKSS